MMFQHSPVPPGQGIVVLLLFFFCFKMKALSKKTKTTFLCFTFNVELKTTIITFYLCTL